MRERALRNRTLCCSQEEMEGLAGELLRLEGPVELADMEGRIIHQDVFDALRYLPKHFVDLLVLDPPYNLSKNYHGHVFQARAKKAYGLWFERVLRALVHVLKPSATVYVCADWKTSLVVAPILEDYFYVRNRITWEREKGRGARSNWKNTSEDIWFCTRGKDYYFDVGAVKLRRAVLAPYRTSHGVPRGWEAGRGGPYRMTYPSNTWTDISVPFWSMPENTDHPTQKPEKLMTKLILASTKEGDFVLDPFLGSGTSVVVAKNYGVGLQE